MLKPLKKLSYLFKEIGKSRETKLVFQTNLSIARITELFNLTVHRRIFLDSFGYNYNKFEGNISNNVFKMHRIAGYKNQTATIRGTIYQHLDVTIIVITITSVYFFVKWLLVLLFGAISVVVTYKMLEAANFSLFVLVFYLLTMFAYVIPTRLFEYECYEAKTFIEKTFEAKEITDIEL